MSVIPNIEHHELLNLKLIYMKKRYLLEPNLTVIRVTYNSQD